MELMFYIASVVSIFSTFMVITRWNGVHALLYLIVSLLSMAVIFYTLGAPFMAALEVIIYAGAIMVLFTFVVMMLNLGKETVEQERSLLAPRMWIGPSILAIVLLIEIFYMLASKPNNAIQPQVILPNEVGMSLFGPYLIAVELAAMLLLAGIVGAYHLGRRKKEAVHRYLREEGGIE